jgi:hypothetical protein
MSPIANYSTIVAALKSIGEIQGMLVAHGATHILTDYKDGEPVGIAFIIPMRYGDIPFRLPANVEKVQAILLNQLASSRYKQWDRDYQEQRRAKMKIQASNVAWRILRDWIRAQMAILETEMVTIVQIFLPYMQVEGGKTLYEVMVDHQLQLPMKGTGS